MAIRRSQHNVYDCIVYMSTNHSCRRVKHLTRLKFEIVAGRDDFAERGSVSRSTLGATTALDLSTRLAARKAPAGHRPAVLWLRLRRAALYRRVVLSLLSLPICFLLLVAPALRAQSGTDAACGERHERVDRLRGQLPQVFLRRDPGLRWRLPSLPA